MDADEQDSEGVEGTGEGAQWTVFFDAGVAAMRVEHYRINLTQRQRRVSHPTVDHVVASISIIDYYQYSNKQ